MSQNIETHPYEIMVRFGCEVGEKAGALRGVSLEQRSLLVGDDGLIQARLERGKADDPKDFPKEKLVELLGERFLNIVDGHKAELEKANAKFAETNLELQKLCDDVTLGKRAVEQELESTKEQLRQATARLEAVRSAFGQS